MGFNEKYLIHDVPTTVQSRQCKTLGRRAGSDSRGTEDTEYKSGEEVSKLAVPAKLGRGHRCHIPRLE
jgi:hypothetical protein